jgi:hypothetical protein
MSYVHLSSAIGHQFLLAFHVKVGIANFKLTG